MKIPSRIPDLRAAVIILVLIWLVFCKSWFWDGKTIPWDNKTAFYPSLAFVAQSLRSGQLPLWNPYVYSGFPMISDPQAMIFSPVAIVSMLAVNQPSVYWFDGIELFHVLLAGLGMLLLSVRLGRSNLASLFAALVYMYGGPASSRLQHVPIIYAYAYFPFALMALDHMLESKRMRSAVAFGVLAGIMAAHQVQVAYLFCLVLLGYACFRLASSTSRVVYLADRWRVFGVAAISGAVTLAVPLFFTLQFLPFSNRLQVPYAFAVSESVHPLTFLTYFMRNFFGNARPETYWGYGDVSETFLYAGSLPIIMVARYGIGNAILLERQFRYFFYVGVVSVLYALGEFTPFYWIAYHIIPGVGLYRRPTDAIFVLNMVLAVAVGFLIDRFLEGKTGHIRPLWLALGGIPVLLLSIWGFSAAFEQQKLHFMTKDILWALLFFGVGLALLRTIAVANSSLARRQLVLALFFLLVVDLNVHNVGTRMNASAEPAPLLMKDAIQKDPVARFIGNGLRTGGGVAGFRADITWAGALWANAPMVLGIQSTQGYNPLRYALYHRVVGSQEFFAEIRPFSRLVPGYSSPILDLLGVRYIVSAKSLAEIDTKVDPERFPVVFEYFGMRVWENPNVLPRVIAATSFYVEPDIDYAIDNGKVAPVDFRSDVVIPHPPQTLGTYRAPVQTIVPLPGQGKANARVVEYRNNVVRIAVETQRDVIIVLNDPWYPYWRAYVDGNEREILQTNYLFRGVHVRSGEHEVDFRFEPYSLPAIQNTFRRWIKR